MARMIPSYIHRDVKSTAERKIYSFIEKDSFLDGWVCIHSLGLAHHINKTEGEIDFLLIGPPGIFCLEIKGGRVERKEGVWYFTDRYLRTHKKTEGPFKQVAGAHFSLIKMLKAKFENLVYKTLFGYGVVFPDIDFKKQHKNSVEWDNHVIYDLSDRMKPFSEYIKRLISYWNSKLPMKQNLSKHEIDNIANYLRGDFELVEPLNNRLDEIEDQIIKLTEQQYKALDRMEYNSRVFFRGTAGTGKTLLAVEKAKRMAASGKKILFVCFNKILGGKLKSVLEAIPGAEYVRADSLHRYFQSVIDSSSFAVEFSQVKHNYSGNELYKTVYPEYFTKALHEVDEDYEYIIIDEGQDLICYEYITALDYVLKGGFEQGQWCIFYDPNNQSSLFNCLDESLVENLKNFGSAEYRLDINCRNTKPISTAASLISGFEIEETLVREGIPVKYRFYTELPDLSRKLINYINMLLSEGITAGDITILFPDVTFEHLIKVLKLGKEPVKVTYANAGSLPSDRMSYSTVQAYKGMENKVIILIGIEELESDWISTVNYVAMTRARQILAVFLKDCLQDSMKKKFLDFI